MRKRIEKWLFRKALAFVCNRCKHHAALEKFLSKETQTDMLLGLLRGRMLKFKWYPDNEQSYLRLVEDNYNAPSPLVERMKGMKKYEFCGKKVSEPLGDK